ncbi:MAG: ATP-dependent zinc protease [Lamprobacter sp.]|uniref:ATP-dependent zinc protease family protein n=1 Tax=Lamprobacter sp. TaxID=3100796 RepID=UPI002B258B7D|nr:ATP-dependent zinc protease [Lamprobacter sp.]MEA3638524.1 ATP-dependent zinc protease [Lamprobacter sp.]
MADALVTLGWREWVGLPELGLPLIKAKVDTGARTSALHAFQVERFTQDGADWVRFAVHPVQGRDDLVVRCAAPLLDRRCVTDSGGHREERPVIAATLEVAGQRWPIELTLTDRDSMRFRMLVGRTALSGRALVDVRRSYLTGQHQDAAAAYSRPLSSDPSGGAR